MSEFVQNNNNARSGFTLLKKNRDGFKSSKRWRDGFVTVKGQRDGFGAFRKETGCHPASSRPTSSTDYYSDSWRKNQPSKGTHAVCMCYTG
jgi:hypothetical protein